MLEHDRLLSQLRLVAVTAPRERSAELDATARRQALEENRRRLGNARLAEIARKGGHTALEPEPEPARGVARESAAVGYLAGDRAGRTIEARQDRAEPAARRRVEAQHTVVRSQEQLALVVVGNRQHECVREAARFAVGDESRRTGSRLRDQPRQARVASCPESAVGVRPSARTLPVSNPESLADLKKALALAIGESPRHGR